MKPHPSRFMKTTALLFISAALLAPTAFAQKKKKKAPANAPPVVKLVTITEPPAATESTATQTVPLPAEKDPQREPWRLNVEPYTILGSGRPGKAATDFDKPDGVAFAPNGLLYATDAKNRRVQIWDVVKKAYVAEFGHGIFGGEIVDIAVSPNGAVYVTDQVLNLVYAFVPPQPGEKDEKGKTLGPYDYQFKGARFTEQHFDKLGGIAVDSRNRIYAVDAHLNEVRRLTEDGHVDPSWQFAKTRADGDTYLHGCEGIAIDESAGNILIASEKDAVIQVFDWETGAYKGKLIGARNDGSGKPTGKSLFSGSVEGLANAGKYLYAVDESVGHIQLFDLNNTALYNHDLNDLSASSRTRTSGYLGFFGHSPLVDFEDKSNKTLQQQIKDGAVIPGQANPPGYFCSPDSIATHTSADGETYIAIADQCNYRLVVYRGSDVMHALKAAQPAPIVTNVATPAEKGGKKKGGKKKG